MTYFCNLFKKTKLKMKLVYPPNIIRKFTKNIIWSIKERKKTIFLTFDDCNSEDLTYWALELLKEFNIKATFFCTGKNIEGTTAVSDILKEGHSVGNHGYEHLNGFKTRTKEYVSDVLKCNSLIDSDLFRPPYGRITPKQYKILQKNYKIIMWEVVSYDFDKNVTPQECFENVKKYSKSGSIIVFHTNEKARRNIQYALPATIEYFFKIGYQFDKIPMNL